MALRVLHLASQLNLLGSGSAPGRLVPRLVSDEFEHHVVTLRPSSPAVVERLRAQGVEYQSLGVRWNFDPIPRSRLASQLRGAALIHLWDPEASAWYLHPLARPAPKLPIVLTLSEPPSRRLAHRAGRRHAHWIATNRTAIATDAQDDGDPRPTIHWIAANRTTIANPLDRGFAPSRGLVIPQGAIPSTNSRPRDEVLADWGLPLDAVLVATCGDLSHSRGLKELIWAADMVRVLHPRMRLVLVGEGPARGGLEYFARTAAVPENIFFAGSRDPAPLLPHCRVYWEGSPRGDSPGMLLDAMACGVPVVASDTPLHRQWIDNRVNGFLVGYAARADRSRVTDELIRDDALHGQIAQAAQHHAITNHSPQAEVESTWAIYRQLAGSLADS